jgi:sigma-E factor negative regulatory protein RseB
MGRSVRVVAVDPKDEYRYGYRLWIDEKTAMPLKTELCDGQGRVIEQLVFASLSLPERIPDSAFQPQIATDGFRWVRQEPKGAAPAAPDAASLWSALRLPPGFRMTSRAQQLLPGADSTVSHLVFSDGVASVSVFVEARPNPAGGFVGPAQMGSSSAYSTSVDGHQVTVVGEVPPRTVQYIASQVRSAQGGSSLAERRSRPPAVTPLPPAGAPSSSPAPRFERGGGNRPQDLPPSPAFAPGASNGTAPRR